MPEGKKNVYLSFHKSFVREGVPYVDADGYERTFNVVTLPKGTTVEGRDLGGWQFSPLFVNESRFKGPDWRDVPMLADREVWVSRDARDADGNPLLDEDGNPERETVKIAPAALKEAITQSRRAWLEKNAPERTLRERSATARGGAEAIARPHAQALSDRDISF